MVVTQLICPLLLYMLPTQGFQDTWFSLWFTDWSFLCFCSQSFVFFSSLTILLMVGLTKVIPFIWMAKEDVVCVCVCVYIYKLWYIHLCVWDIYTHTQYIHTYIHNGILLTLKKEWYNAICSKMYVTGDYLTKWSKSEEKNKYHMISLICGI